MPKRSTLRNLLSAVVIAPVIAACGSGSGSGSGFECSPKPSINSSPPRYATLGDTYVYATDAKWVCVLFLCNGVELDRGPPGTIVDDRYDTVKWTPKPADLNKTFKFKIHTKRDTCGGRTSQEWKVKVLPAPVISAFTSSHKVVNPGTDIALRAVFASGTGYITGYGQVQSGQTISLKDLSASSTYELIVTNGAGTRVRQSITVEVLEPLSIVNFKIADTLISEGEATTLEWEVSGDFDTLVIDPLGPKSGTGRLTSLSPSESTTYTLTATSAVGNTVSASVHLEVIPQPTIERFTASPETASLKDTVTIEASFTGGTAEVFEVLENADQSLVQSDFDISIESSPLHRNQQFMLVVTNDLGATTSQTITVPITGPGTFQTVPSERNGRYGGNAVVLGDGTVFLAGGYDRHTEFFDPVTETYTEGPWQFERRHWFGMTNMADGRVLIAGGSYWSTGPYMTAKIYDPFADTLTTISNLPDHAINTHEAVLLPDGRILLYYENGTRTGADLFDPLTETYTSAAPMNNDHDDANVHLLDDGRVIFLDSQAPEASEIYDAVTDSFETVGNMVIERNYFTSAKLLDGRILVAGGGSDTAEIFDPVSKTFRLLASPISDETSRAAVTLPDGRVLFAGGYQSALFDPVTETFSETGGAIGYRSSAPALLLLDDGRVLKFAGCCSQEIYTP